jgi:hypothetical protein
MLRLITACLLLTEASAFAQDAQPAAARTAAAGSEEKVREIVRGYYVKSDIGSTIYLLTYGGGLLSGVMTVGLTVGDDFVDNEKSSVAWEVTFSQALQNGIKWDEEPGVVAPEQYIQGDLHMFGGTADVELSAYPTRRLGLGIRLGGGVMVAPLLIAPDSYTNTVQPAWGGNVSLVNGGPLPLILGAPTLEYYTKLSHFSVGVDVEAQYVFTMNDLGLTPSGYMKYTF